ncbi:MAG: hypothetical protein HYU27_09400 [Acidobacteria bacterium]|nr:hypothetical protein [Acidobacteriota bacterium]
MEYDPRITLEGAATALGVLGAAIGYLFSVVARFRHDRREEGLIGTRLLILELLERHLATGLKEDQIWTIYTSRDVAERRKYYRARAPNKVNRLQFERELRQLQLDHLIDLGGPDHYHVRLRPRYDADDLAKLNLSASISAKVSRDKLRETAAHVLNDTAADTYRKRDAMRTLIKLGDAASLQLVVDLLDAEQRELALVAADLLAEHLPAVENGKISTG